MIYQKFCSCNWNSLAEVPSIEIEWKSLKLPGYTVEEKIQIAKRHLIPKQIFNHGIKIDVN